MARTRTHAPLAVYLNSRRVGTLTRATSGAIDFRYHRDWLGWSNAFPVSLSLPLREDRYIGEPVVSVFDNLLPDNDELRRRIAARAHADGIDAYALLAAIGRDCVGALQFLPDGDDPGPAGRVDGRMLDPAEIEAMLANLAGNPLALSEDDEFRISIAGAQEKTALMQRDGVWYLPHGTTATTHILKPQIGTLPNGIDLSHSVENEYFCLKLVAALGLPVAEAEIGQWGKITALAVERFDRTWTSDGRLLRIPQEDLCQALGVVPVRKYESDGGPGILQITELLRASDDPATDQRLFLKAQMVYHLLAATDGHAKNFSVHLRPGGGFRLAPLYDVLSVQPSFDARQIRRNQMRMAMAVGDARHYLVHEITLRHFEQTAARCGLPARVVADIAEELVGTADQAIEETLAGLPDPFPASVAESIAAGARKRLGGFARGNAARRKA